MSDAIKHECGIALIQLKKPLSFYQGEVRKCTLRDKQDVPLVNGKAAQSADKTARVLQA